MTLRHKFCRRVESVASKEAVLAGCRVVRAGGSSCAGFLWITYRVARGVGVERRLLLSRDEGRKGD